MLASEVNRWPTILVEDFDAYGVEDWDAYGLLSGSGVFDLGRALFFDAESAMAVARESLKVLISAATHSAKRTLQTSWVTLRKGPGTLTTYRKPTATPQRI
jgi:hypothetical protein